MPCGIVLEARDQVVKAQAVVVGTHARWPEARPMHVMGHLPLHHSTTVVAGAPRRTTTDEAGCTEDEVGGSEEDRVHDSSSDPRCALGEFSPTQPG